MISSTQSSFDSQLPPHFNAGLFSDYYLNELVFADEGKRLELENESRKVREQLRILREKIDPSSLNESQLEEQWIKPVLETVGHHYSVQVKIRYQTTGYRKPDYVLAYSEEDALALTSEIYDPQPLAEHAFAVCDAKRLGAHLDQSSGRGERNPSQQIDEYLRYSELPWGILTDGQVWRLYERDTSKHNVYYAVDLFDLLNRDAKDFLYFYAFFRRAAFPDWLKIVRNESRDFAQSIGDKLEEQVYDALEKIAQGFLNYRRNKLQPTPENLRTIYEQSLVFLYRLLFVLFAESRNVLPMTESEAYRDKQSLSSVKKQIAALLGGSSPPDADHTVFYTTLKDLFFAIDQGNPRFSLPPYNGRLFSETEYPFLAEKAVGDEFLSQAIDQMARVELPPRNGKKRLEKAFIDYRDLDVRHLGAIYEKLLEYQLDIANEALTDRNGKYAPALPDDKIIKQPGQVYLRTGNNERKITGSYYTPDYVVRFIVEHALEPALTEITEQFASRNEEGHWVVRDAEGVQNAVLALNVFDPATGSGHFLVETMRYLAEWLRSLSILQPGDIANGEDELAYWKRQVVNTCLYGVDINPLAVELAKLSLWLATLSQGRPLSFLDHHLRVGNSLVGASLREIGLNALTPTQEHQQIKQGQQAESAGQDALIEDETFAPAITLALQEMAQIEGAITRTVEDVKQQEDRYAHLREEVSVWKTLADVWLARYFGLSLDQATWQAVRAALLAGDETDPHTQAALAQAAEITASERFLHIELEFPEVFFNPDGTVKDNPGFDVVVGNPPYVRQERIQAIKEYLSLKYEVYQGTADLYLYFYEMGLRRLKRDQRLGYITSGTFMNTTSATTFRKYIHEQASFEKFIDFGAVQPFKGVDLATNAIIAIIRKGKHGASFRSLSIEGRKVPDSLAETLQISGIDVPAEITARDEWRFQSAEILELFTKICGDHPTLGQVAGKIYSGVKTGLNEVFIIDRDTRQRLIDEHVSSVDIIKPMRRGEDLRPWYQANSHQFLIFAYQGIQLETYPAIKRYLQPFQNELAKRHEAHSGQCEWYELRPCDYYEVFEKPKILWPDIGRYPRFSRNEGYYVGNTAFVISDARYNLLALLQSRALWFAISHIATPLNIRLDMWRYRVLPQFVERLPIPDLTADQESSLGEIAEHITTLARERYRLHDSIRQDITTLGGVLNRHLEQWWQIKDAAEFQREVEKSGGSIPVDRLAEWRGHLDTQKAEHTRLTDEIISAETRMNAIVYDAFKLDKPERKLIEASTKYPYGSV